MSGKKAAVVLGAGKGKRMKSDLPKVLHEIHNRPMITILLDTLIKLKFERIVVVIGHRGELVQESLAGYPVEFAWQREQLGTGHAVQMARDLLADFDGTLLVAAGDVPFLSRPSIERLMEVHGKSGAAATCLSAVFEDPTGYGRILRDGDSDFIEAIVEHKDASEAILKIKEINTGTFCFDNKKLFEIIDRIDNKNAQGEYYLTDAVKIMHRNGLKVAVVIAEDPEEVKGVNSKKQLEY
ncbi:MAG: NTP transferase domain-containing protein, partial [candidate division Zixibacteria bacterium]|nr:NTP transferase domain-containing protein [candidate division Zixibacteria bacterium]